MERLYRRFDEQLAEQLPAVTGERDETGPSGVGRVVAPLQGRTGPVDPERGDSPVGGPGGGAGAQAGAGDVAPDAGGRADQPADVDGAAVGAGASLMFWNPGRSGGGGRRAGGLTGTGTAAGEQQNQQYSAQWVRASHGANTTVTVIYRQSFSVPARAA